MSAIAEKLHQLDTFQDRPDEVPEIPEAPAFRTDILPDPFASFVTGHAAAIGVPAEMVALPFLANVGSLIGNRLAVQLKRGRLHYPTLWVGIVAPPGAAKTPALNAARLVLDALQGEWVDRYKREVAQWEADVERWSSTPPLERGSKPPKPVLRNAFTTNATIEVIGVMLESVYGLSYQLDELLGFMRAMDQYRGGKGSDRQTWLQLWATVTTMVNRLTREPLYLRKPVVSVVGGIQPDMLADLRDRNGREDGFIDRFLLVRPDVEPQRWTEAEADPSLLTDVVTELRGLYTRIPAPDGDRHWIVLLSTEAKAMWREWYDENVARIKASSGLRAGVLSKLSIQVARFALIMNTLWNLDDPRRMISTEVLANAIWLGDFCLTHWDRCLPLIGQPAPTMGHGRVDARSLRILRDEREQDAKGWVTRSRLSKRLGNVSPADLTAALEALRAAGIVEPRTVETGTKPREEWRTVSMAGRHDGFPQWEVSDYLPTQPDNPNNPIGFISNEALPADPTPLFPEPLSPTGTDDWEVIV
ncbi:MAG: DUF3987 domain-containing protein [Thermomicrobiales bacterium]